VLLIVKIFILSKNTHIANADNSKGSKSDIKTIDPSHPFYIHHSDQPDHVLVPIKSNGINYQPTTNMIESQEVSDSTSSSVAQEFTAEQIQNLVQAINALNQNNFGNADAYTNVAGLISSTLVLVNSSSASSWILDTGIMDHIVSHMSLLTEPKYSNITSVNLPNGATTQVTHTGTIFFNPKLTSKCPMCPIF